ncbi:50S ribosomal protein L23 [Buchnera aphidicola str. Bp (Baizongia pistaciae)]|uniref:Large ribosomal subunit protein uL23 n=1 Tax=Buchnera aphidicola subsp. Baizongia pistaciae (strain Bp) TaxID=224915 RepID=RL23_BUCBP|nr:50S ribosomal protein L23 [Buchnera aphidicola]Q89A70.1 RecName: Full=Large ribosomal subunit protein uL23; AltName: Full=50S ribosomal protein L23 [Buchnera aphidicola str. Bp (Baizongia pistaciae)]AAO27171.1 50S ribosomal protein L23 [Buchnera aphidicola str. Bp (Baizongia pistaciae)]
MIYEKILLKVLLGPHISEKSSTLSGNFSTVIIKVSICATKLEIKRAVQNMFNVAVKNVNTLVVQGKCKRKKSRITCSSNWKKAYVTLKRGQNINFIGSSE